MSVYTISFDAVKPLPWIIAGIVAAVGFALFRLTFPTVRKAWDEVFSQAMAKLNG